MSVQRSMDLTKPERKTVDAPCDSVERYGKYRLFNLSDCACDICLRADAPGVPQRLSVAELVKRGTPEETFFNLPVPYTPMVLPRRMMKGIPSLELYFARESEIRFLRLFGHEAAW